MHISKRQSLVIAVGAIMLFFLTGIAFLKSNQRKLSLTTNTKTTQSTTRDAVEPKSSDTSSNTAGSTDSSSLFTMNNFHRSETKEGRTLWEVNGTRGEYFPQNNSATVHDAELKLFSKNDQVTVLTAKQAEIFMNGTTLDHAHIINDVRVVQNNETTLTTNEAFYEKEKGLVATSGPVKIINKNMEITANKLDGDINNQVFVFNGEVISIIKPK